MRKTTIRGRPGLLFLGALIICLIIFYLSWKTMMSPRRSVVKDIYTPGRQRHPNFHESQRDMMLESFGKARETIRDRDYNFENSDEILTRRLDNQLKGPLNPEIDDLRVGIEKHAESGVASRVTTGVTTEPKFPSNAEKTVPKKEYYKAPDPSLAPYFNSLDRIVHFDLKGAAMNMPYLRKLIPLLKTLGATGLLVEYEDMFPFAGKLSQLAAKNAYSMPQITEFLQLAKQNNLFVIPLIQTFGHMEFILKEYHDSLRESKYTPQVIDSTSNSSYELIEEMTAQVLSAHPDATYLHVGCDEVYELGRGKSNDVMIKERLTTEDMFLRHVRRVANIVSTVSKGRVRPIMWDDELRKIPQENIRKSEIPSLVDIMVWKYTPNVEEELNSTIWTKYSNLFNSMWAASSFKGATGSRQMYTEVQYHLKNHFSWVDVLKKYKSNKFKGVVLTGWQRYDHFATLCELFPVAVPSVAACLATLKNGGFDESIHRKTSTLLNCSNNMELTFPSIDGKTKKAHVTQDCSFPGSTVYYAMQELWGYTQNAYQHRLDGWLSDYQVAHGFSSPGQLGVLSRQVSELQMNFHHMSSVLERELFKIYSEDTVDEWLDENIHERIRNFKEILDKISLLVKKRTWPRRPLPHVEIHRRQFLPGSGIDANTLQQGTNTGEQKKEVNNAGLAQHSIQVNTADPQKPIGQMQNGNNIGIAGNLNVFDKKENLVMQNVANGLSLEGETNKWKENLAKVNGDVQVASKQLNSGMSAGQNVGVPSGSQNFNQAVQGIIVRQNLQDVRGRQNVFQNFNQGGQNLPSSFDRQNVPQNFNQGGQNLPSVSDSQNVPRNFNQGGQNLPVMSNRQNGSPNFNQGGQNLPVMSNRQNGPLNLNQGGQNLPVMSNTYRQNVPLNFNQGSQNLPVMSNRQNIPQSFDKPDEKDGVKNVPAVDVQQATQSGYGQKPQDPDATKNALLSSQDKKPFNNDLMDHSSEKSLNQPKPFVADSGKNFRDLDKEGDGPAPQEEEDAELVQDETEQDGKKMAGNVGSVLTNENGIDKGLLKRGSMQGRLDGAENLLRDNENEDRDQHIKKYGKDPYFLEDDKMKEYERDLLKRRLDEERLV